MSARSTFRFFVLTASLALGVHAASLQQLSTAEMAAQATAIVRATVTGTSASLSGSTVYTHYQLQVSETLKGKSPVQVDVPGGVASGIRQSFPGVPELKQGGEYVLFVWTSSSGINHILGFGQGVFAVAQQADGSVHLTRGRIAETMHDKQGHVVQDEAVELTLSDLRSLVATGVTK